MTAVMPEKARRFENDEAPRMTRAAEALEAENPRWIIVYGIYTREFVAFPRFNAPPGTIAVAKYPPALTHRMRALESVRGADLDPPGASGVRWDDGVS